MRALWEACRPVTEAPRDEWAWLTLPKPGRCLSLEPLAALDLVRLLPRSPAYPWPAWVPSLRMTRAEWLDRYRFASPMYDATGALRSLRFRALTHVREPNPDAPGTLRWREVPMLAHQKALATRGAGAMRGLVLADPMGLALLRGEREVPGLAWDGWVAVCEGEPDLWTWATRTGRFATGSTWASLGIVSGAWTEEIAARIPTGAKVAVYTDDDDTGDRYAERIRATLAGRCDVVEPTHPRPRAED